MGKKGDSERFQLDDQTLLNQIKKTGFDLEYRIAQILQASGWTVISGRYYIDDQQEKVREIDIVAYKRTKVDILDVYTTLIISCKKSDTNLWAFLAKEVNTRDPNAVWQPLMVWSNDKALDFMISQPGWKPNYLTKLVQGNVKGISGIPGTHIFAFQEINKKDDKKFPNNETIFNSITSLMKAQAYEIESLPERKTSPCVYQFNLLAVAEADMRHIFFNREKRQVQQIDQAHHVASYIIKKKQTFSRIHFVHASTFERELRQYDRLHEANCLVFKEDRETFYQDMIKDHRRRRLYESDFKIQLSDKLRGKVQSTIWNSMRDLLLLWSEKYNEAIIQLRLPQGQIDFLTSSHQVKTIVREVFQTIYMYDGKFSFRR